MQVTADERDELDEFFVLNISTPTNATIADGQGRATIVDDDTLLVDSVSPSSGPAGGGVAVAIGGESFENGASVTIGGVAATGVTTSPPTQIQATTPSLAPGTLNDIAVSVPNVPLAILTEGYLADFLDVPAGHSFHDFVESIFRAKITAGCGGGLFCEGSSVTREQMAVFLLKGEHGGAYVPPACTGVFADVTCTPGVGFSDWVERLHAEGITGGCATNPLQFCPGRPVTRAEMAVFLLKTKHGSGYQPPACAGIFSDVPCPATAQFPYSDFVEQLFVEAGHRRLRDQPAPLLPGCQQPERGNGRVPEKDFRA